ncbi:hypothetical protein [Variovorax terrae]|uniref:Uncharacterized protein n=1 Tax=Variovorax terrae TaxID=2923278 RepID=A0A9X1W341_9BURK|nr:hypothetical protein [Variovorax terrae]MCJ0764993.1 hypothetical protein [Variovorax terrae]
MSFLNQLKSQASALQDQQVAQQHNFAANLAQTERACKTVWYYLSDLAQQLNVIAPAGPRFTLDGKTPWPAMKLTGFRVDARRKQLGGQEVYDYVAMGWQIVPQQGAPVEGTVSVNFPPDLQRVETRLAHGGVKHERKEVRHPEKNSLLAIRFDYRTEARGSVSVTPDHERANLAFRLTNANGFDVVNVSWPAAQIQGAVLDELAKLIVAQPSRFA